MTKTATAKRFTVEPPAWGGTFNEENGWRVVDSRPLAPEFRIVATTTKRHAETWARNLNKRTDLA